MTFSSPSRLSIAVSSAELTLARSAADFLESISNALASFNALSNASFLSGDAYLYASLFCSPVASLIFASSSALAVAASADARSAVCASFIAWSISLIVVAFFTRSRYGFFASLLRCVSALILFVASFFAASSVVVMSFTGTTCVFIPGTLITMFDPFCTNVPRSTSVFILFSFLKSFFNASINADLYFARIACSSGSVNPCWFATGTLSLGV